MTPMQIKALVIAGVFFSGAVVGATVNGWRLGEQINEGRETHANAVIVAQNAINAAQTRTAQTTSILADFIGDTDNETAKRLADLRARNAALRADLERLRNRATHSTGTGCVSNTAAAAVDGQTTQPAAGVPAVVPGVRWESLALIYAGEADALRVELESCAALYDQARGQINDLLKSEKPE